MEVIFSLRETISNAKLQNQLENSTENTIIKLKKQKIHEIFVKNKNFLLKIMFSFGPRVACRQACRSVLDSCDS